MKRAVLVFGILAGVIIFTYSTVVFFLLGDFEKMTPKDLEMAEVLGYARYIILFLGVLMAMITYRKQHDKVTYGKAFTIGLLVTLITAFFVGLMEFTYMNMNPEFMDQYGKLYIERLQAEGASQEVIEKTRQEMQAMAWMANPWAMGIFYFFETALLGTLMSLVCAAFMIRRKPAAEQPGNSARPIDYRQ